MTLEEFLVELGKTARKWRKQKHGRIRWGIPERACPITQVCLERVGKYFGMCDIRLAGNLLGLADDLCDDIVHAADGNHGCDAKLRTRLLRACGLKETNP